MSYSDTHLKGANRHIYMETCMQTHVLANLISRNQALTQQANYGHTPGVMKHILIFWLQYRPLIKIHTVSIHLNFNYKVAP